MAAAAQGLLEGLAAEDEALAAVAAAEVPGVARDAPAQEDAVGADLELAAGDVCEVAERLELARFVVVRADDAVPRRAAPEDLRLVVLSKQLAHVRLAARHREGVPTPRARFVLETRVSRSPSRPMCKTRERERERVF